MKRLIAGVILILASSANAGFFGFDDYDDCLLKSMKGVTEGLAAREIKKSCNRKFPPKQLSQKQLSKISGKAGAKKSGVFYSEAKAYDRFSGIVLNGNPDITITSVTVKVISTDGGKTENSYTEATDIEPNKTDTFNIRIIPVKDTATLKWNWYIESATYRD